MTGDLATPTAEDHGSLQATTMRSSNSLVAADAC